MQRWLTGCTVLSVIAFTLAPLSASHPPGHPPAQAHPAISAANIARAKAIVARMTLAEKISELHGVHTAVHQRYVPGIPRLHIPGLRVANGPAGVGPADEHHQLPATALPAPIALAATWNPTAAHEYGVIIGREARALGYGLMEGPDINIARIPQNGRTFEAFGEDPLLVGRMAAAEIRGIQSQHVIADVKHYDANNQESDRFHVNEIVSQRALHEIYLPAFKAAVEQGDAASVMCAYPKVNGTYNCQNDELLEGILKHGWNFDGFVTSDFGATHSTIPSALHGLDLEMPTGRYFTSALAAAVADGKVPMAALDRKLVRRFSTMMQMGVFYDAPEHAHPGRIPVHRDGRLARNIAEQGMVLLRNRGNLLPLDAARLHTIAVIGPYAGNASTGGGGSSHVRPLYQVNPVTGIAALAGKHVAVKFNDGSDPAAAARLAASADVAIVMVGDHETEGRDHPIILTGGQNALVSAVSAANPHTVVVLKDGSAVLMPWVDQVQAILDAWYPGEEDGNAVAAVLFGRVDPSGRLPLSFPRRLADLPAHTRAQYPGIGGVVRYSEGVLVGYRGYDAQHIQPLFPFGFGLSYTTFAFSEERVTPVFSKISAAEMQTGTAPAVTVSFDVRNSGRRAGAEVAEIYVAPPPRTPVPMAPQQLEGFRRVMLGPGQTRRLSIQLPASAFRYWSPSTRRWTLLPGAYTIEVATSSRDVKLARSVMVSAR